MTTNRRSLMKGIAWAAPTAAIVATAPAYAASPCPLASATKTIANVQLSNGLPAAYVPANTGPYNFLVYNGAVTRDTGKAVAANDPVFNGLYITKGREIVTLTIGILAGRRALTESDLTYDRGTFTAAVTTKGLTKSSGGKTYNLYTVTITAARDIYLTEMLKNGYGKTGFTPLSWARPGETDNRIFATAAPTSSPDAISRDTYIESGVCKTRYIPRYETSINASWS